MMSERLEEIKRMLSSQKGFVKELGAHDVEWLIKQAELAEQLEKENKQLKADVNAMENEIVHGNKSIEFETYRKCVRGEIDEI